MDLFDVSELFDYARPIAGVLQGFLSCAGAPALTDSRPHKSPPVIDTASGEGRLMSAHHYDSHKHMHKLSSASYRAQ